MKTIEEYESNFVKSQNNCMCPKCGTSYIFMPDEAWYDESGYGYSTKLTHCKNCGSINVVKHTEDYGFSKINTDRRLYYKN